MGGTKPLNAPRAGMKKNNTVKAIQNDLLDLLPIKLRKIFIPWCLENTVYCTTYREKDM